MGCCSLECRRRSTLPHEIQRDLFGFSLRRDDVVEVGVDDKDSFLHLHVQELVRLVMEGDTVAQVSEACDGGERLVDVRDLSTMLALVPSAVMNLSMSSPRFESFVPLAAT